jgi:hypothetical protein
LRAFYILIPSTSIIVLDKSGHRPPLQQAGGMRVLGAPIGPAAVGLIAAGLTVAGLAVAGLVAVVADYFVELAAVEAER